jgi:DNA processing protein
VSACDACLRRSWLLAKLSRVLDLSGRSPDRLDQVLDLDDASLIAALAGKRRDAVRAAYEAFSAHEAADSTCAHSRDCPAALRDPKLRAGAVTVAGGVPRLTQLLEQPVVVLTGTEAPSDYGEQVARDLGRAIAASGLTLAAVAQPGIATAALRGALDAGAPALAVARAGTDAGAGLQENLNVGVREHGCVISTLPAAHPVSRWAALAGMRLLAQMASLTIVVEAQERSRDLFAARAAHARGSAVAAVPGRIGSELSAGCHVLLRAGATLVRDCEDVLELLHLPGGDSGKTVTDERPQLDERLSTTLRLVGTGRDTAGSLASTSGTDADGILSALGELELMGLLARGDGGRYLPRDPGR